MSSNRRRLAIAVLAVALFAPSGAQAAKGMPLRTGQKTPYGAAGDVTAGLERSYVDNGFGWIKDQRTGLMWEKKDDAGGIHDLDAVFSWSGPGSVVANGTAFTEFIATLNSSPCFAGLCDWRLPTKLELETIDDVGRFDPSIAPIFDYVCSLGCTVTECSCTASNRYWTSSTFEGDETEAWTMSFFDGKIDRVNKGAAYRVRAVRTFRPVPAVTATPLPTPTPTATPTPTPTPAPTP
jgi:hypothetical protein